MISPPKKKRSSGGRRVKGARSRSSKNSKIFTLLLPGQTQKIPLVLGDDPGFRRLLKDLLKTTTGFTKLHKLVDALFVEGVGKNNPAVVYDREYIQPCLDLKKKYVEAKEVMDNYESKLVSEKKKKLKEIWKP